ncbi:siderophore-interacting protein [Inquilinus limosus]|uniref:siderophore-interacting protein n=1 Tax=Inquilinus limosus TaxID=171674 RepID=UPI0004013B91|nr:siderophore-interacting protein [Inquilinus limosus]
MPTRTSPGRRVYRATAVVAFPRLAEFLDPILDSIATHDMTIVAREDGLYKVRAPFGCASLEAGPGTLSLAVETTDRSALNRLKHALVGPITFIAASEKPEIVWSGDETGPALPDDLRILRVTRVAQLTPRMLRVSFHGDDLERFDRPDQLHCRLIFQPKAVTSPEWPVLDDRGHVVWPERRRLPTRVYTIRRIDAAEGEIQIDFALHDKPGPATRWALAAAPGDVVGILGPAANGARPADFYVLAGDETGLPGIARILEQLDPGARGVAFLEIDSPAEEQPLQHPPGIELRWLHRRGAPAGTTSLLPDALRSVEWPPDLGRTFFWGGCEHRAFREIHRFLRKDVQLPADRQTLYSHWHRSLSEEDIIAVGAEAYLP